MQLKTLTLFTLLGLVTIWGWSEPKASHAQSAIEVLTFQGEMFARGESQGTHISANGLTLIDTAVTGIYLSSVHQSPIPFNAIVPQWLAETPAGSSLEIQLRTSQTGQNDNWSEWYDIHANEDWNEPGDTMAAGDMVVVPAADVTHRYIQFKVRYGRNAFGRATDNPAPILQQLQFVVINTSDGPTTAELVARQQALDAASDASNPPDAATNTPRPFVISRAAWCTEPECWYADLEYEPVTHLLLHHTVTTSNGDSAATVRAIWEYHTFTQGWGDIGYNYLVDLDGFIFEGHLNGNYQEWDVVGVHSGAANAGGMAASLLGNFALPGNIPSAAMLNSTADLFAWKADQRDIDPYGASRMVNVSWGLPHILGHRDVYGGTNTQCPGDNAYDYLPWLRNAVATRIGFVSPYLFVDELSSNFTKSNSTWHTGPAGCGNNGHSFYTWSTTDPNQSVNWGRWGLHVPTDGRYRIDVYAPYCDTGAPETTGALYTVTHSYGASTVNVNQDANVGLWMTVGEFDLAANGINSLFLTDLTGTDNGRGVWFDGVRLLYLGEAIGQATNIAPIPNTWVATSQVNFGWEIYSTAPVIQTQLQVATDANMNNLIYDQTWAGTVLQHSHTFEQGYEQLYWRVTAVTQAPGGSTNTLTSTPTSFGLDFLAPTSGINYIFQFPNRPGYTITWAGVDDISGITEYVIEYRAQGNSGWTVLAASSPTATSAPFIPPNGQVYEFRSRASDAAGNLEPPHPTADMNISQAILLDNAIMLPVIKRD